MTVHQYLKGVALCLAITSFFLSCKKEESVISPVNQEEASARVSGLIPDDPAALRATPVMISAELLKKGPISSAATVAAKGKPDNSAPIISLTSPVANATISGVITVQSVASDNTGITLVSFSVDGISTASSTVAPYNFSWNSAAVSNGSHTLMVTAKDAAGNTKSATVQVNTSNSPGSDITKPTVSITSPTSGASISGTLNVNVSAADNVGVTMVTYSVDGASIGSSSNAPFTFSWNTGSVPAGSRTLTAMAKDAAGNSSSSSIQVTVNTMVIAPVPLPSSYFLQMPPVGVQGGEFSCVAWAVANARSAEKYYKTGATSYNVATNIFSPEYIYNQAKFGTECSSGTGISTCLNILKNQGVCTWQTMPYTSTSCSTLPNTSQVAEAANFKIGGYAVVYQYDEVAIKTLLTQNHSLIAGTSIDNNFTYATAGFIWKSFNSSYGTNHSYVVCGYDDAKHAYKIINSWGTQWGDAGYSWIDYDFFGTLPGSVYVMQNPL